MVEHAVLSMEKDHCMVDFSGVDSTVAYHSYYSCYCCGCANIITKIFMINQLLYFAPLLL